MGASKNVTMRSVIAVLLFAALAFSQNEFNTEMEEFDRNPSTVISDRDMDTISDTGIPTKVAAPEEDFSTTDADSRRFREIPVSDTELTEADARLPSVAVGGAIGSRSLGRKKETKLVLDVVLCSSGDCDVFF